MPISTTGSNISHKNAITDPQRGALRSLLRGDTGQRSCKCGWEMQPSNSDIGQDAVFCPMNKSGAIPAGWLLKSR